MSAAAGFSSRIALPLCCAALDAPPSQAARDTAVWSNDGVLAFLLHEVDAEASLRPLDERLAEALAPLRGKLNLIIEMLGRLSYRAVTLPPVRSIDFRLERVGFESPTRLEPGRWLRLELYFHPTYLEPLVLYGRVANCVGADEGYLVQAEIDAMPEATAEAFARLAFMAQRRQLAHRPVAASGGRR